MTGVLNGALIALAISLLVMILSFLMHNRTVSDREKISPFECGFDPINSARISFSLRFFMLTIIFLIFDVEIVLLFPILSSLSFSWSIKMLTITLIFLIVLLVGLLHEWHEGSLNWAK